MEKVKRYICIDLEMSELKGKQRKKVKGLLQREVIQIGAVMLDENFEYVKDFSTFVKPAFSSVSREVEKLTGITNEMLTNADPFSTAFYKFYTWAGNDDITTFSWSNSDYRQLCDEVYAKAKGNEDYREYLKKFVDLQKTFGKVLGAKKALSLDSALSFCALKFSGERHNALSDAINTARILHKLMVQEKYEVTFESLMQTPHSEGAKTNAKKDKEEKYTTSVASFISEDLLQQFGLTKDSYNQAEKNDSPLAEEEKVPPNTVKQKKTSALAKRFTCTRYGIKISAWLKFYIRMHFVKDMKTA